ncbi:MAG: class I SAM-dependent methyltransferase [Nocardioidaceae bacterium]
MTAHQHTPDVDWAEVVDQLALTADVARPMDAQIVDWLQIGSGARVADVGCGAGGMTALLADAVGPSGRVYAIDGQDALLEATAARCRDQGYGDRLSTIRQDLSAGVPETEPLDLVWAAHVVHHLPDQQAAIATLGGMLTEGGRLVLSEGGLRLACLPWDVGVGEPGLEDRLHCAEEGWFVRMRESIPGSVRAPMGWPQLLRGSGFTEVTTRSFLLDLPSPVSEEVERFLVSSLQHRVDRAEDDLNAEDLAAWRRLLDPEGDDYLWRRGDLYCLRADTVHVGVMRR